MATLLMQSPDLPMPADGVAPMGRNRSRKAKNGPKKQPQRGLGVAQLEKLRLQEQSKQHETAAYIASLHSVQGISPLSKFAFPDQVASVCHTSPVNTCDLLLKERGGYCANGSLVDSLISASSLRQCSMLPMQRGIEAQQGHGTQRPGIYPLQAGLSWQGKENFSKDAKQPASSFGFDYLNSSSKSTADASLLSRQMIQNRKECTQGLMQGSMPNFDCATTSNSLLEPLELPCRQQLEFALVGTPSIGNKPKELSSFQIYQNDPLWTPEEKASERKRPRLESWLRLKVLPQEEQNCTFQAGPHYTTGVVRNALGGSCAAQVEKSAVMRATWLENDGYLPDKTYLGPSLNDSTPSVTLINSCSSGSSPRPLDQVGAGGTTLNRTGRSNSEALSEAEIQSTPLSDFLTLGLSCSNSSKGLPAEEKSSSAQHDFANGDKDMDMCSSASHVQPWIRIGGKAVDACHQQTNRDSNGVSLDLDLRL